MGNPTDNFEGKTISFLFSNFNATVTIEGREDHRVELIDPTVFEDINHLIEHSSSLGYSTGMRLLQATCKKFLVLCREHAPQALDCGFTLSYTTDIPRMVGLSGSSAIVVATFQALMAFFEVSLDTLQISATAFPEIILSIERDELGISAGLQDRVVQTYGGVVAMDFHPSTPLERRYTPLDPALLPEMYLLYNTNAGGESGKVHSTVKERWAAREPQFLAQVADMIANTDAALVHLTNHNYSSLAECMDKNFASRRAIYGDEVVGALNLSLAALAREQGLSVKFTGSGGAFVCLHPSGKWFAEEDELRMRRVFEGKGFAFVRVMVPGQQHS